MAANSPLSFQQIQQKYNRYTFADYIWQAIKCPTDIKQVLPTEFCCCNSLKYFNNKMKFIYRSLFLNYICFDKTEKWIVMG